MFYVLEKMGQEKTKPLEEMEGCLDTQKTHPHVH